MTMMALWIVVCLVGASLLHDRQVWMVIVALALWGLIPGVAGGLFVGRTTGLFGYQPGGWFVLCCLVVVLIRRPRELLREIAGRWVMYLTLTFVILAAAVITLMGTTPPGIVVVGDQILVPVVMFALASMAFRSDPASRYLLRNAVIALAALQSLLAIVQFLIGSTLVYRAQFATNYWLTPSWNRWMGTTDHPLVLSMLICAAVPLIAGLRRPVVQVALLALMASAVLITQSRTAAALLPIAVLYVVFRSRARPGAKAVLGVLVVAGGVALLASPLTAGLQSRLVDDTGSTDARGAALSFFLAHWDRFVAFGDGITTSFTVAKVGGLSTSLESAYLMYAVGVGIIVTTLYFGVQVVILLRSPAGPRLRGVLLSGLIVLIIPQTFSSLGVDTLCGPLLWVVLALAAAGSLPEVRAQDRRREHPSTGDASSDRNGLQPDSRTHRRSATTSS